MTSFCFTPATNRYYQWASTKFWKIDRLQIRFPTRLASNAYLYAIVAEHVWRHFASHLLPTATTSELLRSTFQGSCVMLLGTCRVSCFFFCVVYLSCPFRVVIHTSRCSKNTCLQPMEQWNRNTPLLAWNDGTGSAIRIFSLLCLQASLQTKFIMQRCIGAAASEPQWRPRTFHLVPDIFVSPSRRLGSSSAMHLQTNWEHPEDPFLVRSKCFLSCDRKFHSDR